MTIVAGSGSYGLIATGFIDLLTNSGFTWTTGSGGIKFTGYRNIDSNFGTMSGYQNFTYEGPVTTQCGYADETSTILLEASVIYVQLVNGATTATISVPTGQSGTGIYELLVFQPGSGIAGTITWPANVVWLGAASAPSLSATNGAVDLIRLYTVNHSTFYGYKAA